MNFDRPEKRYDRWLTLGADCSDGASNQILLMKWVNNIMPYGSKATGILPMLSKIALHGNFPLIIRHFISKITDCTQPSEPAIPLFRPVKIHLKKHKNLLQIQQFSVQ